MKNFLLPIVILGSFMLFVIFKIIQATYFPSVKLEKLRVLQKSNGLIISYQAQVKRPFFGWTSFHASKYTGQIWTDISWNFSKEECDEMLITYAKSTAAKFTVKVV